MCVVVEYPMEVDLQKQQSISSCFDTSSYSRPSRKRKLDSQPDDWIVAPPKLCRRAVSAEDVRMRDCVWTFEIEPGERTNLECSIENDRLIITSRKANNKLEKKCITLPDFVDVNSICMCFDPDVFAERLLVGFNYQPGYRLPKQLC